MSNTWMIKATTIFFGFMALIGLLTGAEEFVGASIAYFSILGIIWLLHSLRLRTSLPGGANIGSATNRDELDSRLDQIERRLTDVQDVMIALSEKFDRLEEKPGVQGR